MSDRERRSSAATRVVGLHQDDGSFDRAFWKTVPPEKRLEALWDLVLEYAAWRGSDVAQSRLQKSVVNVIRRA